MRLFKRSLVMGSLFSLALLAQLLPVTLVDVTGDSAAHQIATVGSARSIQFVAPTTNTGVVRVGDSGVTSTRGIPMVAGSGYQFPAAPSGLPVYDLSRVYYLVPTGDKVSISWVK